MSMLDDETAEIVLHEFQTEEKQKKEVEEKEKEDSLKDLGVTGNRLHALMRKWMTDQGAKMIKLRDERE